MRDVSQACYTFRSVPRRRPRGDACKWRGNTVFITGSKHKSSAVLLTYMFGPPALSPFETPLRISTGTLVYSSHSRPQIFRRGFESHRCHDAKEVPPQAKYHVRRALQRALRVQIAFKVRLPEKSPRALNGWRDLCSVLFCFTSSPCCEGTSDGRQQFQRSRPTVVGLARWRE